MPRLPESTTASRGAVGAASPSARAIPAVRTAPRSVTVDAPTASAACSAVTLASVSLSAAPFWIHTPETLAPRGEEKSKSASSAVASSATSGGAPDMSVARSKPMMSSSPSLAPGALCMGSDAEKRASRGGTGWPKEPLTVTVWVQQVEDVCPLFLRNRLEVTRVVLIATVSMVTSSAVNTNVELSVHSPR